MASSYSIAKAAQLSGLTTHLIRAWESRYSAVVPARNDGGQRRYSDSDVERLRSLSRVVEAGYRIGDIVSLSDDELNELYAARASAFRQDYVDKALAVTYAFDAPGLQAILDNAAEELGAVAVSDKVIFPFMEELGRSWHENRIRTMNEHLASTVVHALLLRLARECRPGKDAPSLVVATAPGQQHNLGAASCAVAAAVAGYQVYHLGTHIPAEEVLAAAIDSKAVAVLLSVVFPPNSSQAKEAFDFLERELPQSMLFVVGGVSAGTLISGGRGRAVKAPRALADLADFLAKKHR